MEFKEFEGTVQCSTCTRKNIRKFLWCNEQRIPNTISFWCPMCTSTHRIEYLIDLEGALKYAKEESFSLRIIEFMFNGKKKEGLEINLSMKDGK